MGLNLKKHLLCIICLGFEILCKSSLFNKSWLVLWCLHYGALFHVSNHGPDFWRSELMHYIHNQKDIVSNPTRYSAGSWDTTHYKAPIYLAVEWMSNTVIIIELLRQPRGSSPKVGRGQWTALSRGLSGGH